MKNIVSGIIGLLFIFTCQAQNLYFKHLGIADGLSGLGAALEALGKQGIQMIYTTVHQVLAQGNYVLAVSEGTFGGAPTSYYDLWRIKKESF